MPWLLQAQQLLSLAKILLFTEVVYAWGGEQHPTQTARTMSSAGCKIHKKEPSGGTEQQGDWLQHTWAWLVSSVKFFLILPGGIKTALPHASVQLCDSF